jgi:hypothetical protein
LRAVGGCREHERSDDRGDEGHAARVSTLRESQVDRL